VDDGSTDNSHEVLSSFGHKITVIQKENGGQTSTLNAGFLASKGGWICLLDSDDLFTPGKVSRIAELASEYPTAGMIAHDLEYCDVNGKPLNFAPPYISKRSLIDERRLARRGTLTACLPATSGLCIRRDVLEYVLPMPAEIRVCTDNYLKWVILSLFPVLQVPEFRAKQRIHGNNAFTIAAETGMKEARIRLATQNATVSFYMQKKHPHLRKLAWKQYGRLLYLLKSSRSAEARAAENHIRANYSVIETNPSCFFYVAALFMKAFLEDLLKT
jgi:glycosyltransferase involved in cell wall biosynthesis